MFTMRAVDEHALLRGKYAGGRCYDARKAHGVADSMYKKQLRLVQL